MRDTRKNREYFQGIIEKQINRLRSYVESISAANRQFPFGIWFNGQDFMKAMYSIGYPMEEIAKIYPYHLYGAYKSTLCGDSSYSNWLDLISYGVCFGCPKEITYIIAEMVDHSKLHDAVIDRMLNLTGIDDCTPREKIRFNLYKYLLPAFLTEDKAEAAQCISGYFKKWYTSFRRMGLFNDEQLTCEDRTSYLGYWCFEAAGTVKILGLDDSSFLDSPYYPKDLAHCEVEWTDEDIARITTLYESDVVTAAQSMLKCVNEIFPNGTVRNFD